MQRSSRNFLDPSATYLKAPKDEKHFLDKTVNRHESENFSQVTEQLKIAIFSKYFSNYLTEKVERKEFKWKEIIQDQEMFISKYQKQIEQFCSSRRRENDEKKRVITLQSMEGFNDSKKMSNSTMMVPRTPRCIEHLALDLFEK